MNTNAQANTVLIADDEPEVRNVIKRYLEKRGFDTVLAAEGREALGKAKVQTPSVILLDVNMPMMDGFTVCQRLRENPSTRLVPILILTARGASQDIITGLHTGADDYMVKPFDLSELLARIERLLERNRNMIAANPLTRLPGSPSIQYDIEQRIASGEKFGVAYIDIDNFKAYNDVYGYHLGDQVIRSTAELIQKIQQSVSATDGNGSAKKSFLYHVGGDDFILISPLDLIRDQCRKIADEFDKDRLNWYNMMHRLMGSITTKDRLGAVHKFPLMTLTISVSTNDQREIKHYAQVAQIVSEIKAFGKKRTDKDKSFVMFDRRKD